MMYQVKHRKEGPKRETQYVHFNTIAEVAEYMAQYLDLDDVADVERLIKESRDRGVDSYELYRRQPSGRYKRIRVQLT